MRAGLPWKKMVRSAKAATAVQHQAGPVPRLGAADDWDQVSPLVAEVPTYSADQSCQLERRLTAAKETQAMQIAAVARAIIDEKYAVSGRAIEAKWEATLSILMDQSKTERDQKWQAEEIDRIINTRVFRWEARNDGKKGKTTYSLRRISRSWIDSKTNKQTTTGAAYEEWAFGAGPFYSFGLFMACEAGHAGLARQFVVELNKAFADVLKRLTNGAHIISLPLHAKFSNFHFQPTWSQWADPVPRPDGTKKDQTLACLPCGGATVRNRKFASASLPLIGVLRQVKAGLDVDALTGRRNAAQGALHFCRAAGRRQRPLNLVISRWVDAWLYHESKQPAWETLRPFFEAGMDEYRRRKCEQLNLAQALKATSVAPHKVEEMTRELAHSRQQLEEANDRLADAECKKSDYENEIRYRDARLQKAAARRDQDIDAFYHEHESRLAAEVDATAAKVAVGKLVAAVKIYPRLTEIEAGLRALSSGLPAPQIADLVCELPVGRCGRKALKREVREGLERLLVCEVLEAKPLLDSDNILRSPAPKMGELTDAIHSLLRYADRRCEECEDEPFTPSQESFASRLKVFVLQQKYGVLDGLERHREIGGGLLNALSLMKHKDRWNDHARSRALGRLRERTGGAAESEPTSEPKHGENQRAK